MTKYKCIGKKVGKSAEKYKYNKLLRLKEYKYSQLTLKSSNKTPPKMTNLSRCLVSGISFQSPHVNKEAIL